MKVICFDLDDTLHKEINYLKAAYRLIAKEVFGDEWEDYYHQMLSWYEAKEDVFQKVVDISPKDVEKAGLLNMYRYDVHQLCLPIEVDEVLTALKASGIKLGLITDGRSLTQRNKIKALGLDKYFDEEDIIISGEFGSEKPALTNYEYFMKRYPDAEYTYVGDNPKKDFVGANALGWDTVCLLDDGRNIHKQEFEKYGEEYQPKIKIAALTELM